jgi:hypothetical protein
MQAIRIDLFGVMIFSDSPIADETRAQAELLGGRVLEGVTLEPIEDLSDGAAEPVLCRARGDARRFRVFRSTREVDHEEYRPVGLQYRNPGALGPGIYFRPGRSAAAFGSVDDVMVVPWAMQ